MTAFEVNFDGIVGPTHNYAGLSYGNIASTSHVRQSSSPKTAALQGLEKMRLVHGLGVKQAVWPPLRRPRLDVLREIGFSGTDSQIIESAWRSSPAVLAACYSASNMWTANAATVSPSADCEDGKVHLTPANLNNSLHRSIEAAETTRLLRAVFCDDQRFVVHDPLPCNMTLSDEGAANHTRLCNDFSQPGIELFVFGRSAMDAGLRKPEKFPARQTLEASQAIARRHGLRDSMTFVIQQNTSAIDAGVFHNDVISVGNQNVLLYHAQAFVETEQVVTEVANRFGKSCGSKLCPIRISEEELSIEEAVRSYLFNSQLVTRNDGKMTLVCPQECTEIDAAKHCTDRILAEDNPIDQVEFLQLRQSMQNGGGPACLRLRVVLTDDELNSLHQGVIFTDELFDELAGWVNRNYRDQLVAEDLRDTDLIVEIDTAFHELAKILDLHPSLFGL